MSTKKPILIVDDEELNLKLLERFFKPHKTKAVYVGDPVKANRLIYEHEWMGIITDLKMPIIQGPELLKSFSKVHPDGLKVLLTAFADLKTLMTLVNSDAVDYIYEKPFSLSTMQRLIPLISQSDEVKENQMILDVRDLWEGLVIAKSVHSNDGILLLPKGTNLDVETIRKLRTYSKMRNEEIKVRVKEIISA